MKQLAFIIFSFIHISFSSAEEINPVVLNQRIQSMDIDLQIRAEEDLDFDKYLIELQIENQKAKETAENHRAYSAKQKKIKEKARLAYIKKRNLERAKKANLQALEDQYLEKYELRREQKIKKAREKYIVKRNKQRVIEHQQQLILATKIRNKLSRLPASLFEEKRKRVPKNLRYKK